MDSVSKNSVETLPSAEPNRDVKGNSRLSGVMNLSGIPHASGEESNNLSAASIHSSIDLAVKDLTVDEMCQQIKELLFENIILKDELKKNNTIIHEQLNTTAAWINQSVKTNNKHRAMLKNLVKLNQELHSEKEELEKKIANSEKSAEVQPPCSNCDVLKEQLSVLEKKLEDTIAEKDMASRINLLLVEAAQYREETIKSMSSELNHSQCDNKSVEEEKEQSEEKSVKNETDAESSEDDDDNDESEKPNNDGDLGSASGSKSDDSSSDDDSGDVDAKEKIEFNKEKIDVKIKKIDKKMAEMQQKLQNMKVTECEHKSHPQVIKNSPLPVTTLSPSK